MTPQETAAQVAAETEKLRPILEASDLVRTGNLVEARKRLELLIPEHPTDPEYTVPMGQLCLLEGRYWEALAVMGPSLHPDGSGPYSILDGDALLMAAAAGVLTGNIVPGEVEYLRSKAKKMLSKEESLGLPIGNTGDDAKSIAFMSLGVDALYKSNMADERHWFEKTLEAEPNNPTAEFFLGGIYHSIGELQKAVTAYHAAANYGKGTLRVLADRNLDVAEYDAAHPEEWRKHNPVRPKRNISPHPDGP
jgi:tetratricopeptide (TPR) repeat protein